MKRLVCPAKIRLNAAAALFTAIFSTPALSDLAKEPNARGMFRDQLSKPQEKLNNGFVYWVELKRNGEKIRVNNKEEFVANDKVRFHFTPNFDGYAYVYYVENDGNGDKTLLFPAKDAPDNKVASGKEITLPYAAGKDAWLEFDNNPGTEIVRIIVARDKLADKGQAEGSKDVKPDVAVTADPKHAGKISEHSYVSMEPLGGMSLGERRLNLTIDQKPEEKGETTVVNTDLAKPLSVDISLSHKK
jgi:hypothetical protein